MRRGLAAVCRARPDLRFTGPQPRVAGCGGARRLPEPAGSCSTTPAKPPIATGFDQNLANWLAARPLPQCLCKISARDRRRGGNDWDAAHLRPAIDRARHCFGEDRLVFGSDWRSAAGGRLCPHQGGSGGVPHPRRPVGARQNCAAAMPSPPTSSGLRNRMLIGLNPSLAPDLFARCARGHGDTIVLADANFWAASVATPLICADGSGSAEPAACRAERRRSTRWSLSHGRHGGGRRSQTTQALPSISTWSACCRRTRAAGRAPRLIRRLRCFYVAPASAASTGNLVMKGTVPFLNSGNLNRATQWGPSEESGNKTHQIVPEVLVGVGLARQAAAACRDQAIAQSP